MKTAIIILNYNDYKTTKVMLSVIEKYKEIDKIIVVDNKSSDNSYNILKEYQSKKIDIIQTDENKGYAYGNNYGIKYALNKYKIDYIIISNPDILVKDKDIKILKEDLKDKDISLIAPIIKERGYIKRGWKQPKYLNDLMSNINFFHKFSDKLLNYNEEHYIAKLSKVDVVSGCFFMIKSEALKKIDFFDEKTFLYYEENIIGKKLKDNNLNTYIDNTVFVTHNLSVSVDKSINTINKYKILKNSQKYYEKVYNKINIFQMIILRLFYYISLLIAYIIYFIRNLRR